MNLGKQAVCLLVLTAFGAFAQTTTNYVETFDPVVPTNTIQYQIALGGSYDLGISSNTTTIVDFGTWGMTSNGAFQAIGGANENVIQPQLDTKNNARLMGVFIDPDEFNGTAGSYTLQFDVIGADAGKGWVYLGQGSGYDLSGVSSNALSLYLNAGGFASYLGLTAIGDATAETLLSAELDEQTSATVNYVFEYDGSSALALAFGGYNTAMQIDNITISSTNVVPRAEGDPAVVMFGALTSVLTGDVDANNAFVAQIGAGEIVQWNGVNSDGGSFGASGTLVNQGVGASLTNTLNGLVLTTTAISSSNAARTNTVSTAGQLGIDAVDGSATFQQSDATEWTFEFNKQVNFRQVVFAGLDAQYKDRMRVTIDGVNYDLSPADTEETDAWSGAANTEVYSFPTAVVVSAGADITISTHDDQQVVDPINNKWGLYSLVVDVPEQPITDPYDDWLALYAAGMGSLTNLTDNPDGDALDNLAEYALGGDPTDGADVGNAIVFQALESGGTNYFDYVYFKRTDAVARGLSYEVELSDSLVPAAWTNIGYTVIDGVVSGDFQSVTNRIPVDDPEKFIRLKIELQ